MATTFMNDVDFVILNTPTLCVFANSEIECVGIRKSQVVKGLYYVTRAALEKLKSRYTYAYESDGL